MLDLNNKGFAVFGLPDSGKSTLTNSILMSYGSKAFVYDTLGEYADEPYDRYVPSDRQSADELGIITQSVLAARRYNLYVIDEANRFCPSKPAPLPQAIADLNDWRAHYGLSIGFIARRPVQLNQDLTELAHFLIVFALRGKNDIQYLNDISQGLGDTVRELARYHFAVVAPDRSYQVYAPVTPDNATRKRL